MFLLQNSTVFVKQCNMLSTKTDIFLILSHSYTVFPPVILKHE